LKIDSHAFFYDRTDCAGARWREGKKERPVVGRGKIKNEL
jgi:hypothetical protein